MSSEENAAGLLVGHPVAARLLGAGRHLREWDAGHRWVLDTTVVVVVWLLFGGPDLLHHGGRSDAPIVLTERPLAQMLLEGDTISLNQAMEAAARRARSTDVRLNTQRNLLSRRILDEMGLRELEELIQRLREMGMPRDEALADRLAERREALFDEAARFVDRQMQLYASETGRRMRESLLGQTKLTSVEPEEMRKMEALVKRMAKRLASRYARKRHRADKGKLVVSPNVPFGGLATLTLFSNRDVRVQAVSASPVAGGFVVRGSALVR